MTMPTVADQTKSAQTPKILVADDDEQIVKQIQWALSEDYTVFPAADRTAAVETSRREDIPVALLDLGLPPSPRDAVEGLRALEELLAINPLTKVIIVSGNSERENAVRALEKGAFDIFPKPINLDDLKVVLQRAYRRIELERDRSADRSLSGDSAFQSIIGSSSAMKMVFSTMEKVAHTDVPVLLSGESGSGKELVANAIHNMSSRRDGPFVALNCGAIPETLLESELFGSEKGAFTGATSSRRGKLEYAEGGTLFLDEIGDLAAPLQVKILRFLQERVIERVGGRGQIPVDCRIVAATHRDLNAAVAEKRFREDLYFRLAVVKITLPPLREREGDVADLALHFVETFSRELKQPPKKFLATALEAIRNHGWPGNVRELQNRIKRALVLSESSFIGPADLELETSSAPNISLREAREGVERETVARTLRDTNGNVSKAARTLGISRPTLYELMARYGINGSAKG